MSTLESLTQVPPSSPDKVIRVVNALKEGQINSCGSVTLVNGATQTTLYDNHLNPNCRLFLFPTTAHAASVTSIWADKTTIPKTNVGTTGSITINHSSVAQADLTFDYVIFT